MGIDYHKVDDIINDDLEITYFDLESQERALEKCNNYKIFKYFLMGLVITSIILSSLLFVAYFIEGLIMFSSDNSCEDEVYQLCINFNNYDVPRKYFAINCVQSNENSDDYCIYYDPNKYNSLYSSYLDSNDDQSSSFNLFFFNIILLILLFISCCVSFVLFFLYGVLYHH